MPISLWFSDHGWKKSLDKSGTSQGASAPSSKCMQRQTQRKNMSLKRDADTSQMQLVLVWESSSCPQSSIQQNKLA